MANKDAPHGFKPVRQLHGGKIPMKKYTTGTTTAIYIGDVVQMLATGKVKTVTTVSGVDAMCGVAASYSGTASTATEVWVYDDPDTVFEGQSDAATNPGSTTALGHIGNSCDLLLTTGNTTTLVSKHEIEYDAITTATSSAAMKIIGHYNAADNDMTLAHARYECIFARHLWKDKGSVI